MKVGEERRKRSLRNTKDKHIIGSDYAFKDTAWNEISGRYVTTIAECEEPLEWRGRADNAKQGSGAALSLTNQDQASEIYRWSTCAAQQSYEELLKLGVAPEQARIVLPMSFVTEWYWTASLQAVAHFVKLRSDPHAQAEIRAYAQTIDELMVGAFPKTWAAVRGACV